MGLGLGSRQAGGGAYPFKVVQVLGDKMAPEDPVALARSTGPGNSVTGLPAQVKSLISLQGVVDATLLKNTFSLYIIQFANYVLPLVTILYLVRVLGPANYGAVAFAQSLISYFMVFVDYGFDLSATRRISVHRDDPLTVSRVATNTWAAKGLLCALGFVIVVLLALLVPQVRDTSELVLILYGLVIGNVLFPTWLFQGMERMVTVSLINLGMRLLVIVGMLVLVRRPEDYVVYACLLGTGAVLAGGVAVGVAFRIFRLQVVTPSWSQVREAMSEGWTLFLSKVSISVYTAGSAFILGLLANHVAVGYYNAGERIARGVLGVIGPISQAAYPRFSKIAAGSKQRAIFWGGRMLVAMGAVGLIVSVVLFLAAPVLGEYVLGPGYERSVPVIRVLSLVPFLVALSNVLGIQLMVPLRLDRPFLLIVTGAAVVNIGLAILLVPLWLEVGMALAAVLAEVFVTVSMLAVLYRHGLNPFSPARRYTGVSK